jgi:cysteine desulfurase
MKTIYLDNNATTQIAPEVFEAMKPYFTEDYFNPSSMYEPARQTGKAIAEARKTIADCLGQVDPKEILFTGCATESNNTAIIGCAHGNPNRRHIITTSVEHPAVIEVCKELERSG